MTSFDDLILTEPICQGVQLPVTYHTDWITHPVGKIAKKKKQSEGMPYCQNTLLLLFWRFFPLGKQLGGANSITKQLL